MTKLASITMLARLTNDQFGHNVAVMATDHPIIRILNRWPSRRDVHHDARAAEPGLDIVAVHRWFQRGSVPPKFDGALLEGAERRGIGLHPMELVRARAGHTDRNVHCPAPRQPRPGKPAESDSSAEAAK